MKRYTTSALAVLAAAHLAGCVANPIRTGDLLREMTDMNRLTEKPSPAYRTVQFSSYDRRSNLPGGPGWFANADGFGNEPIPGFEAVLRAPDDDGIGEYLVCDVKGPGALVRTWTAAMGGELRLYLDNQRKPLFAGPTADFLVSPYHAIAKAANNSSISDDVFRQAQAGYCPIPFAQRCRMTWVGNLKEVHFYQVQVRQYEPDAAVQTFRPDDLETFATQVEQTRRILDDPAGKYVFASREAAVAMAATVKPHEQVEVLSLKGPQALERLTLKLEARDVDRALRQTLLCITADDYPWAQVQSPVGDFFGAAPGANPFNALPFDVQPDGTMTCRYVMPFESSLRIALDNRGDQPVTVTGSVLPRDYAWTERSMHFYARWRVDHGVVGSGDAVADMPFVLAGGTGRYVGSAVMLLNPCRAPTPWGGWWGEGDEKVFIDDDQLPSTFGTGSEDYFDYAWSSPDIFGHAYCGQPRNDGYGNRGFVANHRWQIVDDLPFRQRIAFYMELFPHDRVPGMSYARIGYYYARPGVFDDHVMITDDDLRVLELPPGWQPPADFVLKDAAIYAVEDLVPADFKADFIEGGLWAGGKLLTWKPASVGDTIGLSFSVQKEGDYQLFLAVAMTPQAGRVSARMDGKPIAFERRGNEIDLRAPHRTLARQFATEVAPITQGSHRLEIVFAGASESVQEPTIGLDYVAVKPVPNSSNR